MQPCSYCGLPTAGTSTSLLENQLASSHDNPVGPSPTSVYCCLGCRIADGILHRDEGSHGESSESQWTITRLGIAIFFTMNVMVFTLVLWTWNLHEMSAEAPVEIFREVLRYACLLFSAPVIILLGGPILESSLDALSARRFTTDVLLLLGVVAAYGYSVAALWLDAPDVYFEVCCMILVALTLGKWLEGTAKQRATKAIRSLRDLLPKTVRVLTAKGEEEEKPTDQATIGEHIRVLPGERVPLDGSIDSDLCVLDEQFITGESLPVEKHRGEPVYAGSLNLSRELMLVVTNPADCGTIARLVQAVEEATASACQTIRLADRLASWFVPLIAAAALTTFAGHYDSGLQHALMAAVSVVLIACPCALGIATPMAFWVAINSGAKRGVLFRSGDAIIQLAKLRSLGLDKTGTITRGELQLESQRLTDTSSETAVGAIALRLARSSNHPVSEALAVELASQVPPAEQTFPVAQIEEFPGLGITAQIDWKGRSVNAMLGSLAFAEQLGFVMPEEGACENSCPADPQSMDDRAMVCVAWEGRIQGIFYLADSLRDESPQILGQLQQLGLTLVILTGDTASRAAAIAQATGVRAVGQLLPEQKTDLLEQLARPVGMVGDGLNDAVSLAKADVGIALDCGADVTRESADVCLLGSTLKELPWAIELARATQKTIRRNLFWAVGYNVVGIGFAMTGNLNPIIAAIAMVGSSFFVLANSLALGVQGSHERAALADPYATSDDQSDDEAAPTSTPTNLQAELAL